MKIKEGFMLKQVCDEYMIVPVGAASVDFKSVIRLNETGAFLWKLLENGAEKADMLKDILDEYDVSEEIASTDIDAFIIKLTQAGILD